MAYFNGKYERVDCKNLDLFLDGLNVCQQYRRAEIQNQKPTMEIAETNGLWTVKINGNPRDMLITFALEQEFEHVTSEGRNVNAIYTIEGNKMICDQTNVDDPSVKVRIIRTFRPEGLTQVMKIQDTDIVCTQVFARINE